MNGVELTANNQSVPIEWTSILFLLNSFNCSSFYLYNFGMSENSYFFQEIWKVDCKEFSLEREIRDENSDQIP